MKNDRLFVAFAASVASVMFFVAGFALASATHVNAGRIDHPPTIEWGRIECLPNGKIGMENIEWSVKKIGSTRLPVDASGVNIDQFLNLHTSELRLVFCDDGA